MKGIIFDVDGTLWDSTREVAVAWNKVLQDERRYLQYSSVCRTDS